MGFKLVSFAIAAACALSAGPALSQAAPPTGDMENITAAPPAASPSPLPDKANSSGADTSPGEGRKTSRAIVEDCRRQERTSGLKGDARRAHLLACVRDKDPRTATAMACKDKGRAKNLTAEALKLFVKQCRQ